MEKIDIYTRKEVKLLKEYLAKKDIYIRSKTIVTDIVKELDGFGRDKQMYTIYQTIKLPGQIFKVLYTPSQEDLIGAGITKE